PAGAIHGIHESESGPVRLWYGLVSLPLFQFVLWRSLFHWALWACVLAGLAHTPLRLLGGHADRHCGLMFLKNPTVTYCSLMLLAISSVLCGGWATRMLIEGAQVETFKPLFFVFLLVAAVVALAPLLLFVP